VKTRVGILGASGYGGAELLRRFLHHPEVEVTAMGSRQYEGKGIAACWPQLAGLYKTLAFQNNDEVIKNCDVVFCATPHGETAPLVKKAIDAKKKVIDLSADFRLPPELYETWYGHAHPHPELYDLSRFGLVELHRDELKDAQLIGNPGCNSSTAILALAPLAANNLLGQDIIVNITTGASGAGRSPSQGFHYTELNESARPYNVAGKHRHTVEVEMTLGRIMTMGRNVQTHEDFDMPVVTFNPHLVPMSRGIIASCYTRPDTSVPMSNEALLEMYTHFYRNDPIIVVQEDLPQTKAVWGSDRAVVSVRYDSRTGHIIAFAAIDNMGKGAAGQAVQNFNVMHGFEETTGLMLEGIWP
jgi:N-acetyl-gamma-glutamyl-phosphate reductase